MSYWHWLVLSQLSANQELVLSWNSKILMSTRLSNCSHDFIRITVQSDYYYTQSHSCWTIYKQPCENMSYVCRQRCLRTYNLRTCGCAMKLVEFLTSGRCFHKKNHLTRVKIKYIEICTFFPFGWKEYAKARLYMIVFIHNFSFVYWFANLNGSYRWNISQYMPRVADTCAL